MAKEANLLLIDDDEALRETLRNQLQLHREFKVDEASSGAEALELVEDFEYEIVILDIGLPDMDGRDVCKFMRQAGMKLPIIMLTGADTEASNIASLGFGADDYITKPFKLSELLVCLRAQLRRRGNSKDLSLDLGPYSFHPAKKMMVDRENGDRRIRLTEKETEILRYLFWAGENVIGRDVLLNEIWGYNSGVTTHTLETHVYRLRQKIERDPSNADILVTEPGGYRLVR